MGVSFAFEAFQVCLFFWQLLSSLFYNFIYFKIYTENSTLQNFYQIAISLVQNSTEIIWIKKNWQQQINILVNMKF